MRAIAVVALGVCAAGGLGVACSDDPLPGFARAGSDAGTSTADGSTSGRDGGGSSDDGGGGGGDAAVPDAARDAGPTPPRCQGLALDGGTRMVTFDSTGLSRFDGVTSVLKSVAWTEKTGKVFVADRTDRFSDYGDPVEVGSSLVKKNDRVGFSHDGMEIVYVTGTSFAEYTRLAAGGAWSGPSVGPFAVVNGWLTQQGGAPSEPVLGSGGNTFFFLHVPASGAPELCESRWDATAHAWGTPAVHGEVDLASVDAAHRVRPTGVAYDDLTLFVYDEVHGVERAATRLDTGSPFTVFGDIGAYPEAAPSQTCDLLYFEGTDDAGVGLFNTGSGI